MSPASVPRFLFPSGRVLIPINRRCLQRTSAARSHIPQCRHASTTTASPKPRLLGKPTKYYPPFHPQRLVQRKEPKQYPGPPMSDAQREEQKTKQYPNMMPAEGTFMFWFLHNRLLHMCITLGVLFSLAVFVNVESFQRTTPFADMLPPTSEFWSHPFSFIATYAQVYKLHTDRISVETNEKRRNMADDVQKRSRYRKAHGLENEQGLLGWTAKTDAELLGPALPARGISSGQQDTQSAREASPVTSGGEETIASSQARSDPPELISVPAKKPPVKRWFGIWT